MRVNLKLVDAAVAVAATADLWLEAQHAPGSADHHLLLVPALWTPVTLVVAVRRRWPVAASAIAVTVSALAQAWVPSSLTGTAVAWMCDMYALAVWTNRAVFRILLGTYVGLVAATTLATGGDYRPAILFTTVSTVAVVLVRVVIGDRERRANVAERERDLAAREAVVEERARIARELHDAIAHNVSMMVVQAGAERRVLPAEQQSTREVLETVEQIGRGALTEMRRLVGMLRTSDDDPLTPQPGIGDLPRLVEQVREAGLPVDFHLEGECRELPVGLELSAYRIVQEALTNALKHAGDARASVRVRYGSDSLELEIVDDGPGGAYEPVASGGHGLVGMRERVALYGGRFEAGRRDGGGFTVRVLLPVR